MYKIIWSHSAVIISETPFTFILDNFVVHQFFTPFYNTRFDWAKLLVFYTIIIALILPLPHSKTWKLPK